ncbi:DUF3276 family protein [Williamwhitmania taraxaci]|uniref:Uncharacterized protein n=1 Tax=Williamwhitmania taraxaci TaxID=1640674 RepID=A0A1G6Q0Q4_9BACT|nr:DUF3276 family protein [Williamwhitmania taraxaci]SDC85366.1 Protein of unknown function [Williamwhitmania taraxaci]
MKEDIFTTQIHAGSRTYFFDVKTSENGEKYLKITESKHISEHTFERYQILIFEKDVEKFELAILEALKKIKPSTNTITLDEKRKKHPNAYRSWAIEDDQQLELLYCEGKNVKELSQLFGRNTGAINARIEKLELKEKYGNP